jgi:membrane protease YdiL (CAAX protease family)
VALLCFQSSRLFEQLAREHGVAGMHGRAALMCSLNTVSLLLMVLLGSSGWDRQGNADAEWLATLPAPAWLLHTAKVIEAALSNLMGWMLLFPLFTGLALQNGLGLFAPPVALAICLPIFLAVGLLGSVVDLAGLATSRSRWLRILRFVGPGIGALIFALALLSSGLSGLKIDLLGDWAGFSQAIAWLPFSEPALALSSWRTAPLRSLGWFALFGGEMVVLLGLGTLLLRAVYRADLITGHVRLGARGGGRVPARGLRRRSFAGWLGAVALKDLLWLRRNPARSAQLASQVVICNGLAVLFVPHIPGLDGAATAGVALFGVGGMVVFNLSALLESEWNATLHWALLPRSLSWFFSRKALFAAVLATVAALPSAGYLLRSSPGIMRALPALAYGLICVVALAGIQTSLWLRQLSPSTSTSPPRRALRTVQLLLAAGVLSSSFGSISRPESFISSMALAVAFAASFWQGSVERVPFALDPDTPRPATATATGALLTLVLMRIMQAAIFSLATRGGVPAPRAAAVAFIVAGVSILGARWLWLRLRGVTGLRQRFGLTSGRGLRVVLQQALLWSLPAIALNLAYWPLLGRWLANAIDVTTQPPPMMSLLAGSAAAVVVVGCIAAPLIEELGYRGMLYGSLRERLAIVPSLFLSTAVFAADHPTLGAVPVFGLSVCATLAFERSRSLYASMLTHALYNAALTGITFVQ